MDRIITAADYWRDPKNEEGYLHYSRFLAEANNEVNYSEERKAHWTHINHATFIMWEDDETIIPKESAHWAQYDEHFNIIDRHDTNLFQQSLIGIKTLEDENKADYKSFPGNHMQFNFTQINNDVLPTLRK